MLLVQFERLPAFVKTSSLIVLAGDMAVERNRIQFAFYAAFFIVTRFHLRHNFPSRLEIMQIIMIWSGLA